MAGVFSVRVKKDVGRVFRVFPKIQRRMRDPIRPIGNRLANRVMRFGPAGVSDHFTRQAELPLRGGSRAWKQSQRAIREGNLTLVDTGVLRRGWEGGAGSITKISKKSVLIGVNRSAIPYAGFFQGVGPTGVSSTRGGGGLVPRRIVVSKGMIERFEATVLDFLVRGKK